MRVALVHSRYDSTESSGENAVVDNEVAALTRAGVEVRLFDRSSDDLRGEALRRSRAAARVALGVGVSPLAEINGWRPDIVHVHNLFPNYGTRWLGQVDCPIVRTVHNFRSVCANSLLFRDGHHCVDCVGGVALPGLVHRCYRGSALATLPLVIAHRRSLDADPAFRHCERVIFLSDRTRGLYVETGLDPAKAVVWPNFLPQEAPTAESSVGREDFALFVGRLRPEKGIVRLLASWPDDLPMTVVGDGPARDEVERASPRSVSLLGARPRSEVDALMRRCRVLVFPSLCLEQFPMVYLEALRNGAPVLAFDTSSVADLVAQDSSGAVCGWDEPISEVLARTTLDPSRTGPHARRAIEERYSERAYVARAVDLYRSLL